MSNELTSDKLKHLCDLVSNLTEIRVKHCNHLAIENFAPELLESLINAVLSTKPHTIGIETDQEFSESTVYKVGDKFIKNGMQYVITQTNRQREKGDNQPRKGTTLQAN